MTKILYAIAASALFGFAAPAYATITFIDNPGDLCAPAGLPGGCEENIQFEKQAMTPATTVTGDTNQTGQPVDFTSVFTAGSGSLGGNGTNQLIAADGLGQANIEACVDATHCGSTGPNGLQLTSLEMKPGNSTAWTDVLINLDSGEGNANIFVTDQMGANFDDPLKNGENFLGIVATAGEVITDVQVSQVAGSAGPFGWNDFKQPRVSGTCVLVGTTCTPIPPSVPEPSSLVLLVTASLSSLWFIQRRRR